MICFINTCSLFHITAQSITLTSMVTVRCTFWPVQPSL